MTQKDVEDGEKKNHLKESVFCSELMDGYKFTIFKY